MQNIIVKENIPTFKVSQVNNFIQDSITELQDLPLGAVFNKKFNDDLYVILQNLSLVVEGQGDFESHHKFIDIHYVVEGSEKFNYFSLSENSFLPYKTSLYDDFSLFKDVVVFKDLVLESGQYVIFDFDTVHRVGISTGDDLFLKKYSKKIVFKVTHNFLEENFLYES